MCGKENLLFSLTLRVEYWYPESEDHREEEMVSSFIDVCLVIVGKL